MTASSIDHRFGSYPLEDVTFLLKDLSHVRLERPLEARERAIQSGVHYSEMLPVEYEPSPAYLQLFHDLLATSAERVAAAIGVLARRVLTRRGPNLALVSLARAGTPVGVLVRRYLARVLGVEAPHYSLSIIRGRGLDLNALAFVRRAHPGVTLQFVDGWTGKGAIQRELIASCARLSGALDPTLAVLADPGGCTNLYGTREDLLVPSACLNATVSGLVSRTVLNRDVIGPDDFHGAKFYAELASADVSNLFVDTVSAAFPRVRARVDELVARMPDDTAPPPWTCLRDVGAIQQRFGIADINLVKPGIGETIRVLLRRLPWMVLVNAATPADLRPLRQLAAERGVPVEPWQHMAFSACGLIKPLRLAATPTKADPR